MSRLSVKEFAFLLLLLIWLTILTASIIRLEKEVHTIKPDEVEIMLKHSDFMKEWDANSTTMLAACEYYGLKYPKIVTAQAILESGNFKSQVFKKYNNPFGLYNSKTKDYYKFSHWTLSVLAYKTMVQNKYKGGDYYKFLEQLPYAEHKDYVKAVKAIEGVIEDE